MRWTRRSFVFRLVRSDLAVVQVLKHSVIRVSPGVIGAFHGVIGEFRRVIGAFSGGRETGDRRSHTSYWRLTSYWWFCQVYWQPPTGYWRSRCDIGDSPNY